MKSTIGATITTTLFSPAVAARRFLDEDPFVASLFTFVMAAFSCAVTQLLVFRAAAGFNSSPGFVVWIFIVNLLSGVTILVGGLCFVSFFVLLLGGKVRPGKKNMVTGPELFSMDVFSLSGYCCCCNRGSIRDSCNYSLFFSSLFLGAGNSCHNDCRGS